MSNLKRLRILTVRCTTCNYESNMYAQSCKKKIWFREMTSLEPYEFYSASIDFLFSLPHYTSGLPVIRLLYHYYIICLTPVGLYPGTENSQIKPVKFNDQGILTSCLQCKILSKNRNMHNNIKCHFPIGNILLWNASFG